MALTTRKKAAAKTTRKKKTAAKTTRKKTTAKKRKTAAPKKIRKGSKYQCGVCGIAVRVDEACGCVDVCDIICCGEQMEPKKR